MARIAYITGIDPDRARARMTPLREKEHDVVIFPHPDKFFEALPNIQRFPCFDLIITATVFNGSEDGEHIKKLVELEKLQGIPIIAYSVYFMKIEYNFCKSIAVNDGGLYAGRLRFIKINAVNGSGNSNNDDDFEEDAKTKALKADLSFKDKVLPPAEKLLYHRANGNSPMRRISAYVKSVFSLAR